GRLLGDDAVLEGEAGIAALEVEAVAQLAVGGVDGIGQLVLVDFGNDIEGRHGLFRWRFPHSVARRWRRRSGSDAPGAAELGRRAASDSRSLGCAGAAAPPPTSGGYACADSKI